MATLEQPVVAVGGVIVRDGRAVIVKRGQPPGHGEWTIPGGRVQLGETLHAAVVREMREETGLEVEVGEVIEVFDRIDPGPGGQPHFHYVVIDYICRPLGGTLRAGDDAADAAWISVDELQKYGVRPHAAQVVTRALEARVMASIGGTVPRATAPFDRFRAPEHP